MIRSRTPARWPVLATGTLVVLAVGAASAGAAGTATLDGTTARYVDTVGVRDELDVEIVTRAPEDDADRLGGFRVSFLEYDPPTTAGAGCTQGQGSTSTVCPTGGTIPSVVAIDLGGGDDELRTTTDVGLQGVRVDVAGGPGNDEISTYQTGGTIDGGAGDDMIHPEARFSVLRLPPVPTPGGVIRGGDGTDTVEYYDRTLVPIDVSLDGKPNDGRGGEGDNVMPDVENVIGSPYGGTLVGSDRPNALTGGESADRIVGGAGKDELDGKGGNDTIDALDGAGGDKVTCGDGADVAYVDAGDLVTSEDVQGGTPCEKVVYAPGVSSSTLRVRSKRTGVKLTCPKASTATCAGTLRLSTVQGRKLAAVSYKARKGKTTAVTLKVKRKPARKAVLVVAPKGSTPIAGRPVTLR